jgi:hypothetical protein
MAPAGRQRLSSRPGGEQVANKFLNQLAAADTRRDYTAWSLARSRHRRWSHDAVLVSQGRGRCGPPLHQPRHFAAAWRSATRSSATSARHSSQASPGSWYIRATLLAGGQSCAHDRDHLAVGGRLLLQDPGGQLIQAGAHLRPGHHRIGPLPWPRAAWQSAHQPGLRQSRDLHHMPDIPSLEAGSRPGRN